MSGIELVFGDLNLYSLIHNKYSGYCLFHPVVLINKACSQITKKENIFKFAYEMLAMNILIGLDVYYNGYSHDILDLIFGDPPCVIFDDEVIVFNKTHVNNNFPRHDFSGYRCSECDKKIHEFLCGWCGRSLGPRESFSCDLYEKYDGDYGYCGILAKEQEELIKKKRKISYLERKLEDKIRAAELMQRGNLKEDHKNILDLISKYPHDETFENATMTYTLKAAINTKKHFKGKPMGEFSTYLLSVDIAKILHYDKDSMAKLSLILAFESYADTRGWSWIIKHAEKYQNGTYKHKRRRY